MSEDDKLPRMHNITFHEAETMFFDHIRIVIFEEHYLRSLQSLLHDYKSILSWYGFPTSGTKSSYIHSHPQRNLSDLVYNTSGGGTYVEAALFSIGVRSEQLVHNIAERLRDDINTIKLIPWPPRLEELEDEKELSPLLVQLLSALQGKEEVDLSPRTRSLASLITQYIAKRPTTTAINATITLHGITRSKELDDPYYKLSMGISYSNMLLLRDVWTMHDLKRCSVCPDKIAEGVLSISIIDNVDFCNDSLTGGGNSYSNMAWDMWIECIMNKDSKMKSGWLCILQNEKQLLVHSRSVNNVARTALKAVIDLVEVSQLVDLSELLEHRAAEESVALFNPNGTYKKTQKSQIIQKLSLQPVDLQEPYITLIDMEMI
ncbi:hypothetical protein SK128_018960 [Halocaridina rubra]|uniref:Uncharacterized protein n=1 Tax=Halocaridina rubra TaxID=373956 RepID=A0AAN8WGU8_HALRR